MVIYILTKFGADWLIFVDARACADPEGGSGPPWNFGKNVVIGFVSGTGFILNSIYVVYNLE